MRNGQSHRSLLRDLSSSEIDQTAETVGLYKHKPIDDDNLWSPLVSQLSNLKGIEMQNLLQDPASNQLEDHAEGAE